MWGCVLSDACIEALLKRRSVRVFKDAEVPLDMILKAIEVARYAPSAGNKQPWRFVIIRESEKLKDLAKILRYSRPLMNAKVAVMVLANKDESPTSYMVDASLAAMYFWLALHCIGGSALCGHCLIFVPLHPARGFIGLGGVRGHPRDPTS
jgi:nitroreductase